MMIGDAIDSEILNFCSDRQNTDINDLVDEFKEIDHNEAKERVLLLSQNDAIEIINISFRRKVR